MDRDGIRHYAEAVGKGLVAGAIGTAAMTASSALEMKWRGRGASQTPAKAICQALELETTSDRAQARLTTIVHWGYGTLWGGVRGVIAATGLKGAPANFLHLGLVWAAEQLILPKLGVAPALNQQASEEVLVDAWHHFVYAESTGAVYDALRAGEPAEERLSQPLPEHLPRSHGFGNPWERLLPRRFE